MTFTPDNHPANEFFRLHRAHDIDAMAGLFTDDAMFRWVPFGGAGKGEVHVDGIKAWRTLMDAFPDLTNEILGMYTDDRGHAFCQVAISGTQSKDAFGVKNLGRHYRVEHMYIFHAQPDGMIDSIVSYWNHANFLRQLGTMDLSEIG
ncbi:MAG: nuclear transport factor 2 family protein [Planctomycetota bacterium]